MQPFQPTDPSDGILRHSRNMERGSHPRGTDQTPAGGCRRRPARLPSTRGFWMRRPVAGGYRLSRGYPPSALHQQGRSARPLSGSPVLRSPRRSCAHALFQRHHRLPRGHLLYAERRGSMGRSHGPQHVCRRHPPEDTFQNMSGYGLFTRRTWHPLRRGAPRLHDHSRRGGQYPPPDPS